MKRKSQLSRLRLLGDLLLVKPEETASDVLALPRSDSLRADKPGDWQDTFMGVVVATGPGDKLVVFDCWRCGCEKTLHVDFNRRGVGRCPVCGAQDWRTVRFERAPMQCRVGDRIVFPRRPTQPGGEDCVLLDGERYLCFHEEQFAYAKIKAAA